MSDLRKVRTTQRPWLELEVGPQEYADLKAQGLLLDDDRNQLLIAEKAAAEQGARPASKKGT